MGIFGGLEIVSAGEVDKGWFNIPSSRELWALSRRPKESLGLPPFLTAELESPRLVVKTFKQTLRGGIS
jgi:hypothetical protein